MSKGISSLRMHPKAPGVLWAHVHGLGPCVSKDGGRTWLLKNKGISQPVDGRGPINISFDNGKPKIMYLVIDGYVYKSVDGGDNWDDTSTGALASQRWDRKEMRSMAYEVSVDPKKGVSLLVGTRSDGRYHGGFYVSRDSGKSWEKIAGSDTPKSGLGWDTRFIRRDPRTEKNICIAGSQGLWYSDDRGKTFKRNDPGRGKKGPVEPRHFESLSKFVGTSRDLYAADSAGVWHSKDAGKGWSKAPIRDGHAIAVAVDPHSKSRIFAVFHDRGVEISQDVRKKQWVRASGDAPLGGGTLGEAPANDAEGDEDKNGDTKKGGSKDSDAKKKEGDDAPVEATGYLGAGIREILFDVRNRKIVYFGSPTTGLHVSTDGGLTINPVVDGVIGKDNAEHVLAPRIATPMAEVAIHPTSGCHLGVDITGTVYHRLRKGDGNWNPQGHLGMNVSELVPVSGSGGHWYALGSKLKKTTDNGATWTTVYESDIRDDRVVDINIASDGTLNLLLERSGLIVTLGKDAKGEPMQAISKERPFNGDTFARSLAVDPSDSAHMVIAASTTAPMLKRRDNAGGVFETWDGGKSWNDIADELMPTKDDDGDTRAAKLGWNRGLIARFDLPSGLLVFGTTNGKLYARKRLNPSAPKKDLDAAWIKWAEINPPIEGLSAGTTVASCSYATSSDSSESHFIAQIADENGATQLAEITGAGIIALWEQARMKAADTEPEDGAKPVVAWGQPTDPGSVVSCIVADPDSQGRLVATDRLGKRSILVLAVPPKVDAPEEEKPDDDKPEGDKPEGDSDK